MNGTLDVITTALVPAQTIVSESLIALLKGLFNGCFTDVFREGATLTIAATIPVLAITLSVCNAVLNLDKVQKVIGSTALVIQAGITATAQMKNVREEYKLQEKKQSDVEDADNILNRIR